MSFIDLPTETALSSWRNGSTQAEMLCASFLHSEGYTRVDPQCPLGGPDGKKDVIVFYGPWKYVAAVYFPITERKFRNVRDKFKGDLPGVAKNKADGIVFFTNQRVSPAEKVTLEQAAAGSRAKAILYSIDAIISVLDSPRGYGMRLQFLRIPMKPEEQASFLAQFGSELSAALGQQSGVIKNVAAQVAEIHQHLLGRAAPASPVLAATIATRATPAETFDHSDKVRLKSKSHFITSILDVALVCYIHRSALDDTPDSQQKGVLRTVGVWIGSAGATPETALFIPPSPEEVPALIESLLKAWRDGYPSLKTANEPTIIEAIVKFHHEFLRIHPFIDGNGRVARLLLEQQARELLNFDRDIALSDSPAYFSALQTAHSGDLRPLTSIITQILKGTRS